MLGFLLVDKPTGWTSHDAVAVVRKRLNTRKVGHSGTLDPQATGLLVMAVGHATRFLHHAELEPKEYFAEVRFGVETDTQDMDGTILAESPVPGDLADRLERCLPQFRGEVSQLPPMFSAVKREGKPLYKYARQGQEVEREPRQVSVFAFELLHLDSPTAEFRVLCSGGTYVRTLAHDLGKMVGCGAVLVNLRRTMVGPFSVEDAAEPHEVEPTDLVPVATAMASFPKLRLNASQVETVRHGQSVLPGGRLPHELVLLLDPAGRAVGLGRTVGLRVQPEVVIPAEAQRETV